MPPFFDRLFPAHKSLSQRLKTGLACMLLPLMISIAATFFSQSFIIAHLDEIVEEATEEIGPVLNIHHSLREVMMPPHDYLINKKHAGERAKYATLTRQVNEAFRIALEGPFALHEEFANVHQAQKSWKRARASGWQIFDDLTGPEDPHAAQKMQTFDQLLGETQNLIEEFYHHADQEIREAQGQVNKIKTLSHVIVTAMLAVGLALAVLIGLGLSRSILRPVQLLTSGSAKLAKGHLHHRVEMDRGDEFGTLADAFNHMAEELEKIHLTLNQLSFQDELTGLDNRRQFQNDLNEEIQRALRYKRSFALALIDVDHFKRVNDHFGHPAGDCVLREVGKGLRATLRDNDRLARIGGEEFAVILPEVTLDQSFEAAERIRTHVAGMHITISPETDLQITVSLGVIFCPDGGTSADELFRQADRALYKAKEQGRNQVCHQQAAERPSNTT
jgi:diguanylate cyclase (GGDEF)-like protein